MKVASVHKTSTLVDCPTCKQPQGEACKTKNGGKAAFPHTSRIYAVDRVLLEQQKAKLPPKLREKLPSLSKESFGDYFADVIGKSADTDELSPLQPQGEASE